MNGKTKLSQYNNSWYKEKIGAGSLKKLIWYCTNSLFLNTGLIPSSRFRVLLLRLFGAKIGKAVTIKPRVNIKYPWKLKIGDNCWLGESIWIDNLDDVIMGNNVCISQGAYLCCGNHDYKKESFDLIVKGIYLQDGVWIGAFSIVCPGVTCASHSILTAGSVLTNDALEYGIYQGNPAIRVRERKISIGHG